MVSRTTIGKGFAGVVRYQFAGHRDQPTDKRAEILGSSGVSTNSAAEMIADFNLGRAVNPKLNFAVWHTSLSFNPDDAARLDSAKMRAITESYLQKMGLDKTQYLIVRHHDRPDNQHVHIIANRVNNAGKTIDDGRNFYRSKVALKELIKEHDLTPIQGQRLALQQVGQLKGTNLARHEMRDELNKALRQETQRPQLLATLKEVGITAKEYFNKEGQATGISFEKEGYRFKGSELGRNLSLAGIDEQLAANEWQQRLVISVPEVAVVPRSVGVVASAAAVESTSISPVEAAVVEEVNVRTTRDPVEVCASNRAPIMPSGPVAGEQSGAANLETRAGSITLPGQVVVVHQLEKNVTVDLEAPARQADRMDEAARMPVPNFEATPVAKQRLSADEVQAESIPLERELLAEQDSSQAGKVQIYKSSAVDKQLAAAVSIPEQRVTLSQAVGPAASAEGAIALLSLTTIEVTSEPIPLAAAASVAHQEQPVVRGVVEPTLPLRLNQAVTASVPEISAGAIPVTPSATVLPQQSAIQPLPLTSREAVPLPFSTMSLADMLVSAIPDVPLVAAPVVAAPVVAAPVVAAPVVAWQYGTILLMDSKVRTSEERMSAVRAALREAGAEVGKIVPPTPGQLAATLLPYRFDPNMPDLEKVTTVLNDVQASGNNTMREQVHTWKPSGKHSSADRAEWPEREGQFNQARILIQDAERGVERAGRVAAALQKEGAHVSAPTRTEDGQVALYVCYHTYAPKINDINRVLDQSNNSPNIELQESTRDNKARYVGAVGVDIREQELGKSLGISR